MGPSSEGTGTARPPAVPTLSPPPPLAGQAWNGCAQCTDEQMEAFTCTNAPAQTKWDVFLLPGAKERARPQKKHGSFEDELSEVLGQQNDQAELKGQCWPVRPESGAGGESNSSPDRWRVPGGRSPSWTPGRWRLLPSVYKRGPERVSSLSEASRPLRIRVRLTRSLRRAHPPTRGHTQSRKCPAWQVGTAEGACPRHTASRGAVVP